MHKQYIFRNPHRSQHFFLRFFLCIDCYIKFVSILFFSFFFCEIYRNVMNKQRLSTTSESSSVDAMDVVDDKIGTSIDSNNKTTKSSGTESTTTTTNMKKYETSDRETRRTSHDRRKSRGHSETDCNDADVEENEAANNESSNAIVRRENLRQLDNSMISLRKSFRFAANSNERVSNNNNNNNNNNNSKNANNNNCKPNNHSKRSQRIGSNENNSDGSNDNGKTTQYSCPICGVCSATQHDFTEHIRGHNNSDGSHNYTCQICFKVNQMK